MKKYNFTILNMPINVFGNSSSNNNGNKIDTSLFVQRPYLRTNYIESDLQEDIDLKNVYKIKNLPDPINDKDPVNKIYIDNKLADMIKRNTQNDDYISFLDNDDNEYKFQKYKEPIYLTDTSKFQLANKEDKMNSKWFYEILDVNGSDKLGSLIVPRIANMYSVALINREDDTNAFLLMFSGRMISDDSYIKLERNDLHNISHIKLIYARPDINNVSGRFRMFLLNESDEWIEVLKFNNNENLTAPNIWATSNTNVNFKNYAIRLRYDNVKSNKEDMAISKIILTYKVL